MIEPDAIELHLKQLIHRETAACIAEAHDDTVDRLCPDDLWNVVQRPQNLEIGGRNPSLRVIDEPDDLNAEVLSGLEFIGQRDGRRAGADEQQSLAMPDATTDPFEHGAPADRGAEDHCGREDEY